MHVLAGAGILALLLTVPLESAIAKRWYWGGHGEKYIAPGYGRFYFSPYGSRGPIGFPWPVGHGRGWWSLPARPVRPLIIEWTDDGPVSRYYELESGDRTPFGGVFSDAPPTEPAVETTPPATPAP